MPAAKPYSETVGAAILKRLAAGESLNRICAEGGMPDLTVVHRWARVTPHFGRRFRVAYEAFRRHLLARRRPKALTPDLIGEICARVEGGERLQAMCLAHPHLPLYATVRPWLDDHPEFARRYRAALAAKKAQRRYKPRRDSEAVAEAICARLVGGETLKAICRDPAMPGLMTVHRWRRRMPGFDSRITDALHGRTPARITPSLYSPALEGEILRRLAAGEAMRAICRSPEMPGEDTVYRWMRLSPPFATRCAEAREQAHEMCDDGLLDALNRAGRDAAGSAEIRAAMRRPKPPVAWKYRC